MPEGCSDRTGWVSEYENQDQGDNDTLHNLAELHSIYQHSKLSGPSGDQDCESNLMPLDSIVERLPDSS